MAIVPRGDAPADGPQEIDRALQDLSIIRRDDPFAGGARLDISAPLAVFRLDLPGIDIGFPEALAGATMIGWRYLLLGNGEAGVSYVDVSKTEGRSKLTSIARNENAQALLAAAHIAETVAEPLEGECELRVLEVPAAKMSALWIVHSEARFIPFIDGAHGAPAKSKILDGATFFSELKKRV